MTLFDKVDARRREKELLRLARQNMVPVAEAKEMMEAGADSYILRGLGINAFTVRSLAKVVKIP
jgi:hypothetical protein